jgi:hypothetical protein
LLTYPDGSRKHISRAERDSLLLSKSARETSEGRYLYAGQVHTFHSLSQLRALSVAGEAEEIVSFLSGHFIFEIGSEKHVELLETPEAMVLRLGL